MIALQECDYQLPTKNSRWTKAMVAKLAKRYPSKVAFNRAHPNAYAAAVRRGWLNDVCRHTKRAKSGRQKIWTKEQVIAIAATYSTKKALRSAVPGAYNAAAHNGWLKEACGHMPKYAAKARDAA
jgi:hypothetical protein